MTDERDYTLLQPPESNREDILRGLRSDRQRYMALPSAFDANCFGIIWLRTCYDEDREEGYQKLVSRLNDEVALDVLENLLDDRNQFDYGADWTRIFEIFPERLFELLLPDEDYEKRMHRRNEKLEKLQNDFTSGNINPVIIEYASTRQDPATGRIRTDEEINASIYNTRTERLHDEYVENYIFIADRIATETGKVLVVFFDDRGRVVRQSRLQADLCEDTAGAWFESRIYEQSEFSEAEIGPDYLPGGARGPPFS